MNQKHLFSLYEKTLSSNISHTKSGEQFLISETTAERITTILRLKNNEKIILFDDKINAEVELSITFKGRHEIVYGSILQIKENKPLTPEIILYPALLKKPALEEIYYVAAQMGITSIQPVISQKVLREWGGIKEQQRLEAIARAAMEQAKQFWMPQHQEPQKLSNILFEVNRPTLKKIYFDAGTLPAEKLAQELTTKKFSKILVAFGPEAGWTNEDLTILHKAGFEGYSLTPTILRSIEAGTVGLGIIRSLCQR